jgi:Zn-dependent metalloprotease/PKD repeat protein
MKSLAAATVLALASGSAAAAKRVELDKLDVNALNRQYTASIAATGVPKMHHSRHERLLGLEQDAYLVMQSSNANERSVNRRYRQTFRGLPIFGENLTISEDTNGQVQALFGRVITGLGREVSTTPRLREGVALELAKKSLFGNKLPATTIETTRTDLVIYVDDAERAHLAYAVALSAVSAGEPVSRIQLIDANNGRLLHSEDVLLHFTKVGTGPGGNQKVGKYNYGTDRDKLDVTQNGSTCVMENANVITINMNHGSTATAAHSFTCPQNTVKEINGAYSPLNDAHFYGGVVFDMYNAYMGEKPLGTYKLTLKVHYLSNWPNASWNPVTRSMQFGDGDSTYYPLVALDVMAHEVSHGYTSLNSGLAGTAGTHPPSINEAFSDMAGEAAEYYLKGSADFLVGADITKTATSAMRHMCNPTQDGALDNAANFNSNTEKYAGAGIYNKAFCTLAKKTGWNVKDAFIAFARANRDYWASASTFDTGANGVMLAACDMGKSGQDVKNAFSVVGVNAGTVPSNCGTATANQPPVANFTSSVSGLTATFTDSSTDSDGSIASRSWDFGDGTNATQTNPSKTYSAAGTYTVKLTVTDNAGATNTKTGSVTVSSGSGGGGCTGTTYTGTLAAGGTVFQPNNTYYRTTVSGMHTGKLTGPSGTNFNLYLQKWGASGWVDVSKGEGTTSAENVSYNGAAGYYTWKIKSASGSGNYTLCTTRP